MTQHLQPLQLRLARTMAITLATPFWLAACLKAPEAPAALAPPAKAASA